MRKIGMLLALGLVLLGSTALANIPTPNMTPATNIGTQESLYDFLLSDAVEMAPLCQSPATEALCNPPLESCQNDSSISDGASDQKRASVEIIIDDPCPIGQMVCNRICRPCDVLPGECCTTYCWCAPF